MRDHHRARDVCSERRQLVREDGSLQAELHRARLEITELEAVNANLRVERDAAAGAIRTTRERGNRTLASLPRTTRTSGWLATDELLPLLSWPLGEEPAPNPISRGPRFPLGNYGAGPGTASEPPPLPGCPDGTGC